MYSNCQASKYNFFMKMIFQDSLFIKRVGSKHILPKSDVDSAELAVLLMMNTGRISELNHLLDYC